MSTKLLRLIPFTFLSVLLIFNHQIQAQDSSTSNPTINSETTLTPDTTESSTTQSYPTSTPTPTSSPNLMDTIITTDPTPAPDSNTDTSTRSTPTPTPRIKPLNEDTTNNFTTKLHIEPAIANVAPLSSTTFKLFITTSQGQRQVDNSSVVWNVIKGGGTINQQGNFQAWHESGDYPNTIQAKYRNQLFHASVNISEKASFRNINQQAQPAETLTPSLPATHTAEYSRTTTAVTSVKYNERLQQCLQDNFTETEYRTYFNPNTERQDPQQLGDKLNLAQKCIQQNRIPNLNQQTSSCLRNKLGPDKLDIYQSGQDLPSETDRRLAASCFTQPQTLTYQTSEQVDPYTDICLEVQLGSQTAQQIKNQQSTLTEEQLIKARECYNLEPNQARAPLTAPVPTDQQACLLNQLGHQRFAQIYQQHQPPTSEETTKVQTCFQQIDVAQQNILPKQPVQVPFLPEQPETTQISEAQPQQNQLNDTLALAGKAPAHSLVDIYIFSEPIIVTTTADANGDWHYQLSYHLPEGNHRAYSVVHHPEQGAVRSQVFNFAVAYAQTNDAASPQLQINQTTTSQDQPIWLFVSAAALLILAGAIILIYSYLRQAKPTTLPSLTPSIADLESSSSPDLVEKQ